MSTGLYYPVGPGNAPPGGGGAQSNQTIGAYAVGNTTAQSSSSTVDARSLSFDGAGIASVGMSGGSVVISVPSGGGALVAGVSTGGNTAGNTGTVSNQIVFAGGNNITLSESTAAGGATVTISALNTVAQSNQTEGFYAVGNTTGQSSSSTFDARTVSFDAAGIISVGMSNGSVIISATTSQSDAAQTNQTLGLYASGNTTGNSSSETYDARSLTIEFDGIVSGGWSTNNSHLLISAVQSNQTDGFYAVGNTTGQSSSTTMDARTHSVDGAGIVSVGYSGGSLVISATDAAQTNQTLGIYGSGNTTGNSSSETYDARSLTIEFDGIISGGWSTNNSHLLISATQSVQTEGYYAVGNTTGASSSTTLDARTHSLDGAGDVSVGYSAGSVIISGPPILSAWVPFGQAGQSTVQGVTQNFMALGGAVLPAPLTATRLNLYFNVSLNSAATASAAVSATLNVALYTRESGANTSILSSVFSTSITGWASCSSSARFEINWNGVSTSSAGSGLATRNSGLWLVSVPCATFLSPGEYWVAEFMSTSSTGSSNVLQVSSGVMSIFQQDLMNYPADSVSARIYPAMGMPDGGLSFTTAAFPATINLTQLNIQDIVGNPYFDMNLWGTY